LELSAHVSALTVAETTNRQTNDAKHFMMSTWQSPDQREKLSEEVRLQTNNHRQRYSGPDIWLPDVHILYFPTTKCLFVQNIVVQITSYFIRSNLKCEKLKIG